MKKSSRVETYWQEYLASLPQDSRLPRSYEIFHFGDTEKMADELGDLVRVGVKTATSTLVWELESGEKKFPKVGDIAVVTDWNGDPLCIIELTEVEVKTFNEIDERFAFDYGERQRTLEWWRTAMWNYYSERCRRINREPKQEMPLLCERFRLLHKASTNQD